MCLFGSYFPPLKKKLKKETKSTTFHCSMGKKRSADFFAAAFLILLDFFLLLKAYNFFWSLIDSRFHFPLFCFLRHRGERKKGGKG